MTTHQLKLATEPFNAIISGNKTIESRLYDAKRQKIQIGDRIILQIEIIPSKLLPLRLLVCLDARHFVTYFLTIIRESSAVIMLNG